MSRSRIKIRNKSRSETAKGSGEQQDPPGGPASTNRWLAPGCFILWALGAGASHWIGIWRGIGTTAILLGILVAILDWKALAPRLQASLGHIILGAGAGLVMVAATYLLFPILGKSLPVIPAGTTALYASFGHISPVSAVILPLVIMSEELVWRGVMQDALSTRFGKMAGVILGALLYAAAHAPAGYLLLTVLALFCGLYWSSLRAFSGSLLPALIAHLIWDVCVFALKPLVQS